MTVNKRSREQMLAHCGELHDDDDVDPREFFKTYTSNTKQNRKAKQLCRQVAETLGLVLSDGGHDEFLQTLQVVSVEPAPDSSRLLVTVYTDLSAEECNRAVILERLQVQMGRLRCEVAASITRKRTPLLVFHLIGRHGEDVC